MSCSIRSLPCRQPISSAGPDSNGTSRATGRGGIARGNRVSSARPAGLCGMLRAAAGIAFATLLLPAAAQDLRVECELRVAGGVVTALAWSPDGGQLAVGGMLGDLVLLDPTAERQPRALLRPVEVTDKLDTTVMSICWAADGSRIALATRTSLVLLAAADGKVLASRQGVAGPLVRIPGTKDLFGIGANGDPERVDGDTLAAVATLAMPPGSPAQTLAVSADGRQLAVGTGYTCRLLVYELATAQLLHDVPHDEGAVHGLAWPLGAAEPWWLAGRDLHAFGATRRFPGQDFVAAADGKRAAVLSGGWQILGQDGSTTPLGFESGVLALHPDGTTWARGGFHGRIDIGRGGDVVRSCEAPVWSENIQHGQLAGDGRFAFLLCRALQGVELPGGKTVSTAGTPPGVLVPHTDGPELVLATDREVSWWRARADGPPEPLRTLRFHSQPEEMVGEVRQIGRWLSQGGTAVDTEGELPPPPRMPGRALPVLAGDVRWVAASLERLDLLQADAQTVVRSVPMPDGAIATAVSPDRTRVAVGTWKRALVVDARMGQLIQGPAGLHGLDWLDDRTLFGVQWNEASAEWAAVIWPVGVDDVSKRLPLGPSHAQLLDLSRQGKRALIGQSGVARVVTWR